MGIKWTSQSDTSHIDYSGITALVVSGSCYTDSIVKEKESKSC